LAPVASFYSSSDDNKPSNSNSNNISMPQNQASGSEIRPVTPSQKFKIPDHTTIKQQQHQTNIFINDNIVNPAMNQNEMETVKTVLNENR